MAELSFSLVFVPAKKFYFGVDDGEIASCDKPFLIAKTEVTSRLWRSVCDWAVKEGEYSFSNSGLKGSHGKGSEDQPVTTSNCTDIAVFGNSLTEGVNTRSGSNLSCAHRKGDRPFRDFTLREAGEALKLISIAPGATGFRLPWARE